MLFSENIRKSERELLKNKSSELKFLIKNHYRLPRLIAHNVAQKNIEMNTFPVNTFLLRSINKVFVTDNEEVAC